MTVAGIKVQIIFSFSSDGVHVHRFEMLAQHQINHVEQTVNLQSSKGM